MPVVRTDGRSVGRAYGHVITKISRMGRLPNFLTHSALLRARGAPLLVDYPPPPGVGGATLKLLEALAACEQKRLVAGVGIPISLAIWKREQGNL